MGRRTGLKGVDILFGPRPVEGTRPEPEAKTERIRTSVYLDPEDVLILDELQTRIFRQERRRPDRSELIRRALRLYHHSVVGSDGGSADNAMGSKPHVGSQQDTKELRR